MQSGQSERRRGITFRRNFRRILGSFACLISLLSLGASAQEPAAEAPAPSDESLVNLSIEDLLNVEVTSVSKRRERRQDAAAAIYVLTQEDIRRSGAMTIPDLLRTVPGVEVARLTGNTWSITARGFGGRFANKLLVLIDGRSVYTPLFSGVYWERQDLVLEDIDRIEVIRGPGGTLWGANAVNGVINIVTKTAAETQGLLISGGAGTEERGFLTTRWGGALADNEVHYRIYGKLFERDEAGSTPGGEDAEDDWRGVQGGGRVDWNISPDDLLTFQGDLQFLDIDEEIALDYLDAPFVRNTPRDSDANSWNLNAVWNHRFSDDSNIELALHYDAYRRNDFTFEETRHTIDFDLQHQLKPSERQEIVWGLAVRHTQAATEGSEFVSFDPENRDDQTYSAFIQDEIALTDELHLILGTKIEHNDYTGIEVQPNARLRWSPNDRHTLWAAVSRAVRTPSQAEEDIRLRSLTLAGPTEVVFIRYDSRSYESEDLLAMELGYRVRATDTLAFDLSGFYNIYNDFRTLEPGPSFVEDGVTVVPIEALNEGRAKTYGFELAADWAPKPRWQIRAGYSFLKIELDIPASDPVTEDFSRDTPEHQFFLQNRLNLPHNIEFDTTLRYVGALDGLDVNDYLEMDARLAWRPREDLEVAIVGQNLFNSDHFEFAPAFVSHVPSQVERGVYAKVTWKFQPGGKH